MDLSEIMRDCRRSGDRRRAYHPLGSELRAAISARAIAITFQPQFAAGSGALVGAEALARWRHERHGEMAGDTLFEIAEASDLAEALSAHVRDVALDEAARWPGALQLSLNVTAGDLAEADFCTRLAGACAAADFPADRLKLEITEQSLVSDIEDSARQLEEVARLGVRIALDDFGAGFCNFGYLKRLPLHAIKLDCSMVEGITECERDLAVLRAIVAMARALGLEVTAEGIETEAQRDAVIREGCHKWQGYLGGRPMAPEEFLRIAE